MKRIVWAVLLTTVLGTGSVVAQPDTTNVDRISAVGINIGIWRADKLDEARLDSSLARVRTASDLYLRFHMVRRLVGNLGAEASIGGLLRGDALIRDPDGLTIRRASISIYPLNVGLRFYPLAPSERRRIMGYISGSGTLVLGVQSFKESGSGYAYSFNYSSETDVTLGGAVGAGLEYRLADRINLGLYGGYQQAKFSKPLSDLPGGVTDFSGPQFMITFNYLIAGGEKRPRGEGMYGN